MVLPETSGKVVPDSASAILLLFRFGEAVYEFVELAREREDAAYEARVMDSVRRGIADIEEGRYTDSVDDAFARAAHMRDRYA